jgi:16S rRNA (guanine966-N2)-methyltransferase
VSIKILGGIARGTTLVVPDGDIVRPTSVMIRRKIFDFYQSLDGVNFIDAFGGSGGMGLEAWSRGATKVFFTEKNRKVSILLKKNIEKIQEKDPARLIQLADGDFFAWAKYHMAEFSEDTVIFIDPPYMHHDYYKKVKDWLQNPDLRCEWWIESDCHKGVPESFWDDCGRAIKKKYEHGDSYLIIF